MNKIGFRTAGFREWPVSRALPAIAAAGFDGVELCLEHPDMRPEMLGVGDCRELAALVADSGLEVASVSYHGDHEEHNQRQTNQKRSVALAHELGARVLILNSQHSLPGRADEQWREFRALLENQLLPAAVEAGVRLALEPEPGMFLHGSAEMLRLLSELPHPALGVNLDIGHAWLTDDDLPAVIAALAPSLFHLHWEDFPAGKHQHLVPGEGDMPLADLHDALQTAGYQGYYTIDLFNITDDPEAYARASLQATRQLLARAEA